MDVTDYEGGPPDPDDSHFDSAPATTTAVGGLGEITDSLRIRILTASQQTASRATTKESQSADKENDVATGNTPGRAQTTIKGVVFTLRLNTNPQLRRHFEANKTAENQEEFSDEESRKPRYLLSCRPRGYCEQERHYCAHPMICGTRS